MRYAGFWRRFAANFVDGLILLPLGIALLYATSRSRESAIAAALPLACFGLLYEVLLHGTLGQTVGKMAAGIQVRRTDGGRIAWIQAWRRSAVQGVLAVTAGWLAVAFYLRMTGAEYEQLGWLAASAKLGKWTPHDWIGNISLAWGLSEVVVTLFNRRRRALHDYMAGTVVVYCDDPWPDGARGAGGR